VKDRDGGSGLERITAGFQTETTAKNSLPVGSICICIVEGSDLG
jgi:hypothetical protein